GDQAAADDRRSRLRREDARDAAVLRGRRQGQDHLALPWPRNGAPGDRHQALGQGEGRRRRVRQGRAGRKVRGTPGRDGAGAAPTDTLTATLPLRPIEPETRPPPAEETRVPATVKGTL